MVGQVLRTQVSTAYRRGMSPTPDTLADAEALAHAIRPLRLARDMAIRAALADGHRQAEVARVADLTPSAVRKIAKQGTDS